METNKSSIFRKESLDRISSPEELDRYLVVTGPGVWFPLLAAVALLIGMFVWMILGRLETVVPTAVSVSGGSAVCYVSSASLNGNETGLKVRIADQEYDLKDGGLSGQIVNENMDPSLLTAGGLRFGEEAALLSASVELPDGIYEGEIVVETINPIRFIVN